MQNESAGISNEVPVLEEGRSVYDFLYHDAQRVGSFLAQLDPNGHLQSHKHTDQRGGSNSGKKTNRGNLSLPGVGGYSRDGEESSANSFSESSDRTYDPLWTNALSLLDLLDQGGFLSRDIEGAALGQLVVMPGVIKFFDLRLVEKVLNTPAFAEQAALGRAKLDPTEAQNQALGIEILRTLPHTLQGHFCERHNDEITSVSWMNMKDEGLIVSATDILMKYGTWIAGEWVVLAIKDAEQDSGPRIDTELQQLLASNWDDAVQKRGSTIFALLAESMSPFARQVMGRPAGFYGITPILIFRKINPAAAA